MSRKIHQETSRHFGKKHGMMYLGFSHPNVYAEQRKNGQSHEWSKAFAEATESYDGRNDKLYMCIQESFDSLEEPERDKQLTIFFNHFSEDPVYNRICKKYFWEVDEDVWLKLAQQYTEEFHKCVANNKSEIYADAYADRRQVIILKKTGQSMQQLMNRQ